MLETRFREPHQHLDAYIGALVGGRYWPEDSTDSVKLDLSRQYARFHIHLEG